jgi:hypothetical protein
MLAVFSGMVRKTGFFQKAGFPGRTYSLDTEYRREYYLRRNGEERTPENGLSGTHSTDRRSSP